MRNIFILFILFILTSCSASWHLRQAIKKSSPQEVLDMITTKYPEFIKTRVDTIKDTTFVIHEGFDTTIVTSKKDTIIISNIKIYRNFDTIRVISEPRVDTIVTIKTIPKYIVNEKVDYGSFLNKIIWIFALILIIGISVFLILNRIFGIGR